MLEERVGLLEGATDEVSVEGNVPLLSVTSLDYSLLLKLPLMISGCLIFSSSDLLWIWVSTILGFYSAEFIGDTRHLSTE